MATKTWTITLNDQAHTIRLERATFSGERKIFVDEKLVEKHRPFIDSNSDHAFEINGHNCIVHVRTNGLTYKYDLSVDGKSITTGKPVAILNLSSTSTALPEMAVMQQRLRFENQVKSSASWFFFVAALSAINSFFFFTGSDLTFLVGLGMTQVVDGFSMAFANNIPDLAQAFRLLGILLDASIIALFVFLGVMARNQHRWAFIVGMIVYGLDAIIFIIFPGVLSLVFHALALWGFYSGIRALRSLKELEARADQPAPAPA